MATTTNKPAIEVTQFRNGLTLAFSNGAGIQLDIHNMAPEIRDQAMLHGFKQKLVDAAAISRDPDTGRSATIDDKYAAVREVYDRLLAGSWNKPREGATVAGGLLFRALCLHYPNRTPDAIKAFLEKKTPTEKAALRSVPAIAEIIETLKVVPTDAVDTDTLLAGLED